MLEKDFLKIVIDIAHMYGWRVAHFKTSQTAKGAWVTAVQADGAGFPDLVLVRKWEVLFAELKCGKNKLGPAQEDWRDALLAAGQRYCLWHENELELIEAVLR